MALVSLVSWINNGLDQNGFTGYPIQPNSLVKRVSILWIVFEFGLSWLKMASLIMRMIFWVSDLIFSYWKMPFALLSLLKFRFFASSYKLIAKGSL